MAKTENWTYADYLDNDYKALMLMAETNEAKFIKLFEAHYGHKITTKSSAKMQPENTHSNAGRENWTYADYQDNDYKALELMAETNEAKFIKLFEAHYGHKITTKSSAKMQPENTHSNAGRENWTYADYQDNDYKALELMAETNEAKFIKLFEAHYGHPPIN